MAIIHGHNIIVSIGGTKIAFLRTCDISSSLSLEELIYPSATNAIEYLPTRGSWKMNFATMMGDLSFVDYIGYINNKTKLNVSFHSTSSAGEVFSFSGYAYISSFKMSAPHRKSASLAIKLQGSGPLNLTVTTDD